MKKFFGIILMCAIIIASMTALSFADAGITKGSETGSSYRMAIGEKAARGLNNVAFGWTEIPKRVVDLTKETNNPIWGVFAGTFQGALKAMARTVSGASDIVTAPISPEKEPFIQPDINVE